MRLVKGKKPRAQINVDQAGQYARENRGADGRPILAQNRELLIEGDCQAYGCRSEQIAQKLGAGGIAVIRNIQQQQQADAEQDGNQQRVAKSNREFALQETTELIAGKREQHTKEGGFRDQCFHEFFLSLRRSSH